MLGSLDWMQANMSGPSSPGNKVSEAKRHISILDRSLAGPVASVWMTHLFGIGPVAPEGESAVVADSNVEQPAARFTVSRTEDAIDSVLPCVAEEWLRPMIPSRFSNPAKLQFQFSEQ